MIKSPLALIKNKNSGNNSTVSFIRIFKKTSVFNGFHLNLIPSVLYKSK